MKAAVCHAFSTPLAIEDVAIDEPRDGEVAVRIAACAICHSDIHFIEGAWGGPLPAIYGHEAAGVVEAAGPGVSGLRPGDPVIVSLIRSCGRCDFCARGESVLCDGAFAGDGAPRLHTAGGEPIFQAMHTGAFAERVVVDQSQAVRVPEDMPLDSAALLACGVITGYGAVVNTAGVPPGASVAVIGAGGVGLNSLQGAALSDAEPIVAIDVAPAKLEAAKAFGATDTVDPAQADPAAAVRALTRGRGADYVFVTVGSVAAIDQGIGLLRRGGTLVVVGITASGVAARLEVLDLVDNRRRIVGSKMGSSTLSVDVPKLVALYGEGRLKLDELITARYPLDGINEAIAAVNRGEALRNVIVF